MPPGDERKIKRGEYTGGRGADRSDRVHNRHGSRCADVNVVQVVERKIELQAKIRLAPDLNEVTVEQRPVRCFGVAPVSYTHLLDLQSGRR